MDNTQLHTPQTTSMMSKYALFTGIVLVAVVSVVLAIWLPKRSADNRNRASTAVACAGSADVPLSTCNGGCANDTHCAAGMICYKEAGAAEGNCRNPQAPTALNCQTPPPGTQPPTVPPTVPPVTAPPTTTACVKTCTFDYNCSAGETCKGTNSNNTATAVETSKRAATATELAYLKADQKIAGTTQQPDSSGKMKYTVISKVDTTYTVYLFVIQAPKGSLNPQYKIMSKTFPIAANTVVEGTITQPSCGRYQVDLGSQVVVGTSYQLNSLTDYFWGAVYETPCQSGCCVAK